MGKLTLAAPAKLNLTLDILGRRPDGYHELQMVMHAISLQDTITVETAAGGGIRLTMPNSSLPTGPENLAWRAAEVFLDSVGRRDTAVSITVEKRIPVQAGMAGGSTDGAAVLRALRTLLAPDMPDPELERLGEQLGSDVPFCVRGGCALAEGRGERLTALAPLPPCWIAVCKPDFGLSTPALFGRSDGHRFARRPSASSMAAALCAGDLTAVAGALGNVFEELLTPQEGAVVSLIEDTMKRWGALNAVMTGSGPTVFGLFPPEGEGLARRALDALRGPSMETALARPVLCA